ncbi:MAG: phosphate ABC transporter, permease protein PstA, partial [Planctomycetales bacterium]
PGGIGSVSDLVEHPARLIAVPFDMFTAMPLIIYNWASQAGAQYEVLAAAGIVVLLSVLLLLNTCAIIIRHHFQKQIRW